MNESKETLKGTQQHSNVIINCGVQSRLHIVIPFLLIQQTYMAHFRAFFFPFPNENSKGNSSSSLHNNAQFIYTHLEIDGNSISEIQLLFASNMVVGGAKRCLARVSFSTNIRVIYQDLWTGF